MRTWLRTFVAGILAFAGVGAVAQSHQHGHAGAAQRLGELSFPNRGNAAAQEPFLRGVKLLHNFTYAGAIKAFQEAQAADPDFVLAYWGEAMAYNQTLWANQNVAAARAALAKLGPTPDARRAKARDPEEVRWLAAAEVLYGPGDKASRDIAYAGAMEAFADAEPANVEAQAFAALATLGRSHGVRDVANYIRAAARLEALFPTHQSHPGVLHYLIHAYDDPVHAPLGLRAARLYGKLASDNAHALHMTSHIFLALGMWPETEAANLEAIAASDARLAQAKRPPYVCGHGPIWLVYARLQQGEDASADIARCKAQAFEPAALSAETKVIGDAEAGPGGWSDMMVRQGIETGRWDTDSALPEGRFGFARFNLAYARVLKGRNHPEAARSALADLIQARGAIAAAMTEELPDEHQLGRWLDLTVDQAKGIAALAGGQHEAGLAALRAVAIREAALPPVFGPPALQKPTAELLGDELLAAGRKTEAAEAYRQALAVAPGRRLSVMGLKAATTP